MAVRPWGESGQVWLCETENLAQGEVFRFMVGPLGVEPSTNGL